jgi:hypothetical protein
LHLGSVLPPSAGELRNPTFELKGRRLAMVGTSSDVDLWDLAALHHALAPVALAWDQPAPAVVALRVAGGSRQRACGRSTLGHGWSQCKKASLTRSARV